MCPFTQRIQCDGPISGVWQFDNFFCDIYWLNLRRGCTSKEKTIKKEAVKLGLSDFFLQTDFKLKVTVKPNAKQRHRFECCASTVT